MIKYTNEEFGSDVSHNTAAFTQHFFTDIEPCNLCATNTYVKIVHVGTLALFLHTLLVSTCLIIRISHP